MTLINHPIFILITARQHCVRNITVFFSPLNMAVTVMQL